MKKKSLSSTDNISTYFLWKEALWLSTWNRLGEEKDGLSDSIRANLTILFNKMDKIRDLAGLPIVVHCAWRPKEYNTQIGGATNSAHIQGMACDFSARSMICDDLRKLILPHLEKWNLRMEDNPGSNWVHIDYRQVGPGGRFFKP